MPTPLAGASRRPSSADNRANLKLRADSPIGISMDPMLFEAGLTLGALALIVGAVMSFLNGTAPGNGESFRTGVEPALANIRGGLTMSRGELSDLSIKAAIAFCAVAMIFDSMFAGLLIGGLLWKSKPMIRRLTSEEQPLMAIGNYFSTDLIIGLYLPVTLAQFMLGRVFIGLAMFMVIVALSWPAGGGLRTGASGHRKPAWQQV